MCYYKYVYIRTGVQSVNSGAGLPANICEKVIELSFPQDKIRNFSIIAHIDHGKSTLADRILEQTNSVSARDMESQLLDDMELERERGITIKARAVSVTYDADNGEKYLFNLIDTPGHVDFNYEVSRSLAACEGAVLIVDASQGIEAQTLANTYLAVDSGLEIVPVINKIDLPSADPDRVIEEIEDVIGIPAEDAPKISAKQGINIHAVLEKIVSDIPAPTGDVNAPLRALIFDSYYDSYKGVIIYVRLKEGQIHPGDEFKLMATGSTFTVVECGLMHATSMESTNGLYAGEVGYIAASIKTLADAKVGDTVTLTANPAKEPLPGYREAQPMVYCGIYPVDGAKYGDLKDALEKLQLNDAALSFEPETSVALGFGYRCGFLGLLHMEIIQERLEREYQLDLITTAPSVIYRITKTDGTVEMIDNPTNYPDPALIAMAEEPMTTAHIYSPKEYVGNIMELCQDRRGIFIDMQYIDADRVDLHYELPLAEIIYDFFDTLKSRTRGYASFDYELKDYVKSNLVKLDIMLNGDVVDALSFIIHADKAYGRARKMAEKLKEKIPRQLFEVPIQACIGGKIIARETVKAMRKDVLAKCYGGDISRKKKLLENEALTEQEEELKEKFFRNDKEKGLIIVNRRVDEYLKYKGFRVLVTDSEKDPVKAWTAYADRWRVEDAFATLKDRLGCNRIRCSDNKALQGKTFLQFIATGLSLMVRSRIRSYMRENKKAGKLNLVYESDSKILQVLNNVMQTRFNHGYYFDEVAGKKIKYFEALGVGVPGAGPETPEDVQEEPEAETLLGTDIEI